MKNLWAPWRLVYILSDKKQNGCVFCNALKEKQDEKNFILYRSEACFVIMNIFPYNPGHIMVVPNRHINNISLLDKKEKECIFNTLQKFCKILETAFKPSGLNMGLNMGETAGAGIVEHIHFHIVPRWQGDVNFMSIVADTRVISESLTEIYFKIKEYV